MKSAKSVLIQFFIAFIFIASFSFSGCSKHPTVESKKETSPQIEHPVRGPKKAALVIEQFSDFYCRFCKQQAAVLKKVTEAYPDKIRWTFRHLPISGEPGVGSFPVHEASMCAAEQGKFWEFHDIVFALDKRLDVYEIAKKAQLDKQKFDACFKANRYRDYVSKDMEEGQKRGVSGTPTFFINGELVAGLRNFEYFAEAIDPELAKKAAAQRKAAEEEFLKTINPSETGRPSAGPANAAVTITEFSDFHCPFCVQLTATMKQIMEAYPQDVRRVWRHFPLPIHPYSPYAHLASECAHSQGQFWAFHEKVFADPGAAHSEPDFLRIAEALKLNAPQFKACFESPDTKKKIENDVLLGMSKKVGSTPTVFVNDEMFVGAKSFDELKKIIDRKLAEAKKK